MVAVVGMESQRTVSGADLLVDLLLLRNMLEPIDLVKSERKVEFHRQARWVELELGLEAGIIRKR
jgi:hypothetical protein